FVDRPPVSALLAGSLPRVPPATYSFVASGGCLTYWPQQYVGATPASPASTTRVVNLTDRPIFVGVVSPYFQGLYCSNATVKVPALGTRALSIGPICNVTPDCHTYSLEAIMFSVPERW